MKFSKVFMLGVRFVLGVATVLVIWNPLVNVTFVVAQGQDPRFDMGDNYELWSPGYVIYWRSKEKYEWERIIHPERVVEFALQGPWLLGRTEKGWFAINKKTHQLNYPYASRSQLQAVTGLDIASLDFMTDPSPYEIVYPRTEKAVANANRFCWVLIFVLPILLGFGPYVPHIVRSKKQQK